MVGKLVLETLRLRLHQWVAADLAAACPIFADPQVMRYVGDGHPYSRPEVEQMIAAAMADYAQHGFGVWAVVWKEDGAIIGDCGLGYLPDPGAWELGYTLAQAYWGRGLATEAACATIHYAFSTVKLTHLIARVHPHNLASQYVLQKAGLRYWQQRTDWPSRDLLYRSAADEYLPAPG